MPAALSPRVIYMGRIRVTNDLAKPRSASERTMQQLKSHKVLIGVAALTIGLFIAFLYWPQPAQLSKQCAFVTRGWTRPSDGRSAFRTLVVVKVWKGSILWNDTTVDRGRLEELASQSSALDPAPVIVFEPQPNSGDCETEQQIQGLINKAASCETSKLCGLGTREEWKAALPFKNKNGIE